MTENEQKIVAVLADNVRRTVSSIADRLDNEFTCAEVRALLIPLERAGLAQSAVDGKARKFFAPVPKMAIKPFVMPKEYKMPKAMLDVVRQVQYERDRVKSKG